MPLRTMARIMPRCPVSERTGRADDGLAAVWQLHQQRDLSKALHLAVASDTIAMLLLREGRLRRYCTGEVESGPTTV
jgi:hypothetical protein